MRKSKSMIALMCLLLLSGCSISGKNEGVKLVDQAKEEVTAPVTLLEAYDGFFDKLTEMNETDATKAFFDLENVAVIAQLHLVETVVLNETIQSGLASCFGVDDQTFNIEAYEGDKIEEINDIYQHGFTFVPFSGVMYPVINYHEFESVMPYVSHECASYIALKIFELDDYMGGYDLTQEDLVERLMAIEQHLTNYAEGETSQSIYELYKTYLYEFIPLKFRTPGTLNSEDALFGNYDFFIEAHGETVTAKIISQYMDGILSNNYEIDEGVLDVLNQFNKDIELYFKNKIT